ncbi:hypothetical protein [Pedobacter nototheniae]|uniref:hypothetical protein n=1 Tax=Pedobacter nototheniae TaxID=2488994 RepID=UPI0013F419BF|nr:MULTISPECIES: hypothetical protein [Pedobacter]
MKKLELNKMKNINGGELCGSQGYTGAALIGAALGGPIMAASFFFGAWIGCSM